MDSGDYGRFADFLVVASDNSRQQFNFDTLLPGVPAHGSVACAHGSSNASWAQYQLFMSNPTGEMTVRLSCRSASQEVCDQVLLSADSRSPFPENQVDRRFRNERSPNSGQQLTVSASDDKAGGCKVPCVLYIRVELPEGVGAEAAPVEFEISATAKEAYTLLLDGDDPVSRVARSGHPEYFLFDSRRASPLLTITVTVPYDPSDPYSDLLSVYVLDCAERSQAGNKGNSPLAAEKLKDPNLRPSSESYRFRGLSNARGQLVVQVNDPNRIISEGSHCYYRIAVVSNRIQPATISIRGFDWRPGQTVPLGFPVTGLVDGSHRFSYEVEGEKATGRVMVLSMEVCSGDLQLKTSSTKPDEKHSVSHPSLSVRGGLDPKQLSLPENRWLEVVSNDNKLGSYILTAEDPSDRVWLESRPSSKLKLQQISSTSMLVEWDVTMQFGKDIPMGGVGSDANPVAEYEVFYMQADAYTANISTPCGLYDEYKRENAKRILTKEKRSTIIDDLKAKDRYCFNVVARSLKTGRSFAYEPEHSKMTGVQAEAAAPIKQNPTWSSPPDAKSFWMDVAPVAVLVTIAGVLFWVRPCCKGGGSRGI